MSSLRAGLAVFAMAVAGEVRAQGRTDLTPTCPKRGAVEALGRGTIGGPGRVRLELLGAPLEGLPLGFRIENARAQALGTLLVGDRVAPQVLAPFGATLYPAPPFRVRVFQTDASGASPELWIREPVPLALCGRTLVAQAAVVDPDATGGAVLTGAFALGIGGPHRGPLFPAARMPFEGPRHLALADLNHDGVLDVAFTDRAVTILLGRGDGTFELGPETYLPSSFGEGIAVGFIDGDAHADLAVATSNPRGISILLGTGRGTFVPGPLVPTVFRPLLVELLRLDGDGHTDLVAASAQGRDVLAHRGNGDGTFGPGTRLTTAGEPNDLATGDVNGDGFPDVLVGSLGPEVVVLLSAQNGTLTPSTPAVVGGFTSAIDLADLDADGALDLIVSSNFPDQVRVALGRGDGTFAEAKLLATDDGEFFTSIGAADLDRDGIPDLVCGGRYVSVLLGQGEGAFGPRRPYVAESLGTRIALGDVDGDRRCDVVFVDATASSGDVGVLLGRGDGSLLAPEEIPVGSPRAMVAADFDDDGWQDLALTAFSQDRLEFFRGSSGGFLRAAPTNLFFSPISIDIAAGDLDRDGDLDLVTVSQNGSLGILHRQADGSFQLVGASPVANNPRAAVLGDFDLDGVPDAVVGGGGSSLNDVVFLRGRGDGLFLPRVDVLGALECDDLDARDLDGDGTLDLVLAGTFQNLVRFLPGAGDGSFGAGLDAATGTRPVALHLGDWDGDGLLDVATANEFSDDVSVLRGLGGGAFGPAAHFAVGREPSRVRAADLDRDGILDLAVTDSESPSLSLLIGNGAGGFAPARSYTIGFLPTDLAVTDVDGDHMPDVVSVNAVSSTLTVLRNQVLR